MAIYNQKVFESKPELLLGNVQIIACAGSGKTEFISERVAYQIYKKISKPSEIVAITFNENAAEELRFRIRDKIKELIGKQPDIGNMFIGTIHSFAFQILKEFVPIYRGYDMLNEQSRLAFAASLKWTTELNLASLYRGLQKRGFQYNKYFAQGNPNYWQNWTFTNFLADVDFYREESLTEDNSESESFKYAINIYIQ